MKTMIVWPMNHHGTDGELVVETSGNAFFFDRKMFSENVPNSQDRMVAETKNKYPKKYRYSVEIPITFYMELREKSDKIEMGLGLSKDEESILHRRIVQLLDSQIVVPVC